MLGLLVLGIVSSTWRARAGRLVDCNAHERPRSNGEIPKWDRSESKITLLCRQIGRGYSPASVYFDRQQGVILGRGRREWGTGDANLVEEYS
jgi:hypothetical protein